MDYRIWVAYAVGYLYSVLVGHLFIKRAVDQLWRSIGWDGDVTNNESDTRPYAWIPPITGFLERILYTSSLQLGKGEFVGVWLAIKVASQWKKWNEDEHRCLFQIFLIGSGLGILYASAGYKIIDWVVSGSWLLALVVAISVIATSEVLRCWAARHEKSA